MEPKDALQYEGEGGGGVRLGQVDNRLRKTTKQNKEKNQQKQEQNKTKQNKTKRKKNKEKQQRQNR